MLSMLGFPYGEDRIPIIQHQISTNQANEEATITRMVHLGFGHDHLIQAVSDGARRTNARRTAHGTRTHSGT